MEYLKRKEKLLRINNYDIILIDKPKDTLDINNNTHFINQLRILAANGFGVKIENKSIEGIYKHVIEVDSLIICYLEAKPIAFASAKIIKKENIIFLCGIVVNKKNQKKGIATLLMETLYNHHKKPMIALTTQNPVMYDFLRKFCKEIFPSPKQNKIPKDLQKIGYKLIKDRNGIFNPDTFIIRNLYPKCRYEKIPQSKNLEINQWFDKCLRIRNRTSKDGILLIGKVKD